jgi:hypothetical protein
LVNKSPFKPQIDWNKNWGIRTVTLFTTRLEFLTLLRKQHSLRSTLTSM